MGSGEEFLPAEGGWENFSPGKITIRRRWMAKFPLREEFPCPNSSQGKHFPSPREFDPLYGDGKVETFPKIEKLLRVAPTNCCR